MRAKGWRVPFLSVTKLATLTDTALIHITESYTLITGVPRAIGPALAMANVEKYRALTNVHYTINRDYQMPGFTAMGGFKVRW